MRKKYLVKNVLKTLKSTFHELYVQIDILFRQLINNQIQTPGIISSHIYLGEAIFGTHKLLNIWSTCNWVSRIQFQFVLMIQSNNKADRIKLISRFTCLWLLNVHYRHDVAYP